MNHSAQPGEANSFRADIDPIRRLELMDAVGTAIASSSDLTTIVQSVTDAATELTGAQFGSFFYNVLDDNGESYLLYALSGAHPMWQEGSG
jgi:GAF domain-containing protein